MADREISLFQRGVCGGPRMCWRRQRAAGVPLGLRRARGVGALQYLPDTHILPRRGGNLLALPGGVHLPDERHEVAAQGVPQGLGRAGQRHRVHNVPARLLRRQARLTCVRNLPGRHGMRLAGLQLAAGVPAGHIRTRRCHAVQ